MVFATAPTLAFPETVTDLASLLDTPLYTRREGCCSRMMLENNLSCVGHELQEFKKVIVFDDIHVIVKAVLDGGGLAFLSRDVLEDDLASGRLVAHYVPGFTHARERALIIRPHRDIRRSAAALRRGPVRPLLTRDARVRGKGPGHITCAGRLRPAPDGRIRRQTLADGGPGNLPAQARHEEVLIPAPALARFPLRPLPLAG